MEMKELPVNQIVPNPLQPREVFDKDKLKELAATIKDVGVLQPILVRSKGDHYEIIAGERRWKATQIAGLKTIPAVIKELPDSQVMIESLIENIHRANLKPMEQAKAIFEVFKTNKELYNSDLNTIFKSHFNSFLQLINKIEVKIRSPAGIESLSTEERIIDNIVKQIGFSHGHIYRTLKLLELPNNIQEKATKEGINLHHLVSIAGVKDQNDQQNVFDVVVKKELSSRETTALTKVVNRAPEPVKRAVLDATVPVDVAQMIIDTKLVDKDQEALVNIAVDEHLSKEGTEQLVDVVKASPEPVKRAVLNGKIDPEIAKEITTAFEDLPDDGMEQVTIEAVRMKDHSPEYIKMHVQERKKQAEGRGVPEIKKGRNRYESTANGVVSLSRDVSRIMIGTVIKMPKIHQDRTVAAMLYAHKCLEIDIRMLRDHDILTDEDIDEHKADCARQLTEGISIPDPENGIDETEFIDTEYTEV